MYLIPGYKSVLYNICVDHTAGWELFPVKQNFGIVTYRCFCLGLCCTLRVVSDTTMTMQKYTQLMAHKKNFITLRPWAFIPFKVRPKHALNMKAEENFQLKND